MLIDNKTVMIQGKIVTIDGVSYQFPKMIVPGQAVRFPADFPQELREVVGDAVRQMGPINLTEGR